MANFFSRVVSLGVLVVIAAGSAVFLDCPAHAADLGTLTCTGFETQSYSPKVTFESRAVEVTVDTTFNPCVSSNLAIRSGVDHFVAHVSSVSCAALLATGTDENNFEWSDGTWSTFSYSRTVSNVNGSSVVTETGTIAAGTLAGHKALKVVAIPDAAVADCVTKGVSQTYGSVTLVITPV